jgi:hypothetical protein
MRHLQLRAALVLAALLSAGIALAQNQTDIAYLQSGVGEIAPNYDSGSLVVFGDQAFPVVNGRSRSGGTEPIIAAARLGQGRLVVMGYTDSLEHDGIKIRDTARMLANMLRWAGGEKRAPRIGVYGIPGLAQRLRGLNSAPEMDARDIELSDRNQVDVVVILARSVTAKVARGNPVPCSG